MKFLKTTLRIGLDRPIGFLHMTDTHLPCYVSGDTENEEERKQAEAALAECLKYADSKELTVLHTGDLMTCFNDVNFEIIDRYFGNRNYIFTAGNHDFCHEGGRWNEKRNFEENIKFLAPHFSQNLIFDARLIGGLNVVSLPNGLFQIDDRKLEMLKAEVVKGFPILLCLHVPVFTPAHADARLQLGSCAQLMGVSEEYLVRYPKGYEFHRPDKATKCAIEYIKQEPMIRAVVAGHTHMNYEEVLEGGTVQIVTDGTVNGYAREIIVE